VITRIIQRMNIACGVSLFCYVIVLTNTKIMSYMKNAKSYN
jgi:hypothetical protein